jgi:hypothetical protein
MELEAKRDRRETERFPVQRSVEVTTSEDASDYLTATIVDFSEQGLRVTTQGLLNKGEQIIVHWGNRRLTGKVAHCCYEQSGTTAGINLSTVQ